MFKKLKEMFGGSAIALGAPVSGKAVPISEVPDPTFAQGILGPGVAVQPEEGRVAAPADGTVTVMFETGHAVSLTTADGVEVLIHVGIDTVQLKGQHFKACCKQGDQVKKGDTLIEFDQAAITAAGYNVITPMVVCNADDFADVKTEKTGAVAAGELLMTIQKK